ncbi:hypothetical protein T492DRAFT_882682, partial [Pavlovales sp. CCMP2436]
MGFLNVENSFARAGRGPQRVGAPINVLLATEGDVLLARFRAMPGVVAVKDDRKQIKVRYSNARPMLQHVIVHFVNVVMPTVAGLELGPQLWPAPEPELQFEPEPEPQPEPQPQLASDAEPARRDLHGRAPPTQELPDAKREPDAGGENDDWRSWTLGQYSRMEGMWRGRAAVPIDKQDDSSFQTRQRNAALIHPRKGVLACVQYHAPGSIAKVVELLQVPERIALQRDAETALYMVQRLRAAVDKVKSSSWVMAGASSSAAVSLLSAQLPGPGLEVGTNGGFDGPGGERALLEQAVPKRAEAALYAIVLDRDAHDRSGQPAELDLETVKEVYKATQTVHAALKVEQFEALKAAGLTYLHAAFGFALVDHLG